jgi:5'-methylthioadenosine phosphorylase
MSSLVDNLIHQEEDSTKIRIESTWGNVPSLLINTADGEVLVIDRHHADGNIRKPPHEIEHRANIHAAVSISPDLILSINSVGTMREDLPPGDIGIAGDVLDLSIRPWTFHDDDAIHADRTKIFNEKANQICKIALQTQQQNVVDGLIVAQCIGPQFESPAEIDALVRLGADVVGMTLGPESRLVAESGIPHAALSCSSNWAAGRTPGDRDAVIDHHAVDSMAASMRNRVAACITELLKSL